MCYANETTFTGGFLLFQFRSMSNNDFQNSEEINASS